MCFEEVEKPLPRRHYHYQGSCQQRDHYKGHVCCHGLSRMLVHLGKVDRLPTLAEFARHTWIFTTVGAPVNLPPPQPEMTLALVKPSNRWFYRGAVQPVQIDRPPRSPIYAHGQLNLCPATTRAGETNPFFERTVTNDDQSPKSKLLLPRMNRLNLSQELAPWNQSENFETASGDIPKHRSTRSYRGTALCPLFPQ